MIKFCPMIGERDWPWITKRVPLKRVSDTCGIMAVNDDTGEPVGCIIFDNFLNSSCQVTIALDNPLPIKYGFLEEAFKLIFVDLNLTHMYCMIAENNTRSLRLNKRLGFVEKMRIPNGYLAGVDYIVTELDRENCQNYHVILEELNHGLDKRRAR